ncbi:hypothetical protein [Companilactobacillus kedongensis]|uniref:hypothetical protein n=1 Tax=Companilactobacillus kedongensis TaxID=2486004 RepID=UPI000F78C4D9|nr:hypothetical protein [Companilactobacillus kedongensis]
MVFVDESTKFPSSKTGTLTLKPGQMVAINQLIENVSEQALVGDTDYFVYLNMDNKLAKTTTVVPKIDVKESSPTTDDDAERYAYQVAWQKENDFEADHD